MTSNVDYLSSKLEDKEEREDGEKNLLGGGERKTKEQKRGRRMEEKMGKKAVGRWREEKRKKRAKERATEGRGNK